MSSEGRKDPAKVLDRMMVLCSRREYCTSDILKKTVTALDGDREEARRIVEKLVLDKYLDDARYASAYVRDKASITGWGPVKIRYMLLSKGIPESVISAALAEVDDARASSKLHKLLETKARSLKGDPQRSLKLKRFALSRGYGYDEAAKVVDAILCKETDESL